MGVTKTRSIASVLGLALALGLASDAAPETPRDPDGWRFLLPGKAGAISGIVPLVACGGSTSWLVAHDVKRPASGPQDPPLHRVDVAPSGAWTATVVAWPAGVSAPNDLEALAAVPGRALEVLAVESGGTVHHLQVSRDLRTTVRRGHATIPAPPPEIEGFTVGGTGARALAVWSGRGLPAPDGKSILPADLRWGTLTWDGAGALAGVVETGRATVRAPWPPSVETPQAGAFRFARHVADLYLRSDGRLFAVSALDPGDEGPFVSALYEAGAFSPGPSGRVFTPAASVTTRRRFTRKCEAIAPWGAGFVFASDDETDGGWMLLR